MYATVECGIIVTPPFGGGPKPEGHARIPAFTGLIQALLKQEKLSLKKKGKRQTSGLSKIMMR